MKQILINILIGIFILLIICIIVFCIIAIYRYTVKKNNSASNPASTNPASNPIIINPAAKNTTNNTTTNNTTTNNTTNNKKNNTTTNKKNNTTTNKKNNTTTTKKNNTTTNNTITNTTTNNPVFINTICNSTTSCKCGKTTGSNIRCAPYSCFTNTKFYGTTGYGGCVTYFMVPGNATPTNNNNIATITCPTTNTNIISPISLSQAISPSTFLQNGTNIIGYFMWQGNFISSTYTYTPVTQYFFTEVSTTQTPATSLIPGISNLVPGSGSYTYATLPIDNNINAIILFTGYSNCSTALSELYYYNGGISTPSTTYNDNLLVNNNGDIQMYESSINYLINYTTNTINTNTPNIPSLIGISFGGGNTAGAWGQGTSGGIYSIYEATTTLGATFSYTEYSVEGDVCNTQTGVGT